MLKQGKTWFTLENDNRDPNMASDNVWNNYEWRNWIKFIYQFILEKWQDIWTPTVTLPQEFLCATYPGMQSKWFWRLTWNGENTCWQKTGKEEQKSTDHERRCTQWVKIGPTKRVEPISLKKVHDSGSSLDSGAWVQIGGDLEYTPKVFNDPKNTSSDKENDLMNDSQAIIALNDLNIMDGTGHNKNSRLPEWTPNFVGPYCPSCVLKWHRCLCISESDWEDTATQHMPQNSSPIPNDSQGNLEKN